MESLRIRSFWNIVALDRFSFLSNIFLVHIFPQIRLEIMGDEGAPWGKIVKVMDTAKTVGIKAVNAFTKEPAKP